MSDKQFADAVQAEVARARKLFPDNEAVSHALTEEVGEVSKALMYESWDNLTKECIQVAAMAQRLAVEGDPTMREFRGKSGAELLDGSRMPGAAE